MKLIKITKDTSTFQQGGNVRNKYGYATRQIGANPVLDSVIVENGAPNINIDPLTGQYKRAKYYPDNNTMHIGNEPDAYEENILAEIAHAKQYVPDRVDFDKLLAQKKYNKLDKALTAAERVRNLEEKQRELEQNNQAPSKYYRNSGDSLRYRTPGTVEHDAHSVIEPKIRENYNFRYDRWAKSQGIENKYKQGGNINSTGYTPGYASMNNSYNVIPSNNITMQNTPFPVLGIGSNGQQQMMYPGNNYNFKGSSHVTEIPMKKYQEGGEVNQEPIPLQAELGEWFSTPDGMLAKVKAKHSHKKQDKDDVSDVLQPGSFIYSDDKKLIIDKTKKVKGIDLEEITFGRGPIEYKETEQTPLPEEIKFIDIMNKNKMTPAQIAAQVYAKYPSTDREKDAFSISANEQNKLSRTPYLAVLQELNKRKQTKQPQQFRYGGPVQHFQEGGSADGYGYAQTPPGFNMPVVGENPTSTFSVPVNQDNIRASGSKIELTTAGDPYVYMINADGTAKTKKKGAANWINMNENQTAALNKQIEAGIFDANYKPKKVKPAATVRTKQDLDKHDNKVTPYVQAKQESSYINRAPYSQAVNDAINNYGPQNINYTPQAYNPSNNPWGINTTNGLVTPNPYQSAQTNTYVNPTVRAAYDNFREGILFNGPHSASDYNYQVPPIILNANPAPQYMRNGASDVVTNNYQQGGMLGMVKNMATKQSSQQPSNKTSGIGGNIINMMSGLSNQQGNFQGGMYGGIKNIMNGMSNQPNNQSMYQPMNTFDPVYNQPTNNAITGLGYKDPMEQRDKAFRNQGMYNSNLYSQPTTTNKQMFNFEQGGYIPHFQAGGNSNQPTNNTRTGGAGGAAGPIGGIIGAVTDIVGMIAGNVRNDKNLKKARKMLEEDRLEQLRTNSTGTNVKMAGNMMNYASQDPAYEYLNLSNQYARGDNAYQNIGSNLDNAQLAAQNQAMSGSSGFMRNAASLGLSPHQAANYAASMQANAIGNNNQLGLNYASQRGSNIQNQLGYNSRYDDMYSQDQQLGGASVRGNLNKLNSNMISGNINTGVDGINNTQAINSGYRANMMGLDNQAYTRFVNNNAMMGNSLKNGFNSGQELYLNQQARNNYDPRNSYGYTQENPYQIPAGPSSPSTGFNEQNPFNPYAIPYGPR